MSEDVARTLIDSVFGGTDRMGQAYQHGPVCVDTVLAIVGERECGRNRCASQLVDDYIGHAASHYAGLRNLCATDVLLIAQLLRNAEHTVPHGYAVDVNEDAAQTAALDAVNYAGAGDFDTVDAMFDGLQSRYGLDGLQRLLNELVNLHVALRRAIRDDQHP